VHRFEVFDEIQTANRASSAFAVGQSGSSLAEVAAQMRKQKEEGKE
jgi:hypothetical protein